MRRVGITLPRWWVTSVHEGDIDQPHTSACCLLEPPCYFAEYFAFHECRANRVNARKLEMARTEQILTDNAKLQVFSCPPCKSCINPHIARRRSRPRVR